MADFLASGRLRARFSPGRRLARQIFFLGRSHFSGVLFIQCVGAPHSAGAIEGDFQEIRLR